VRLIGLVLGTLLVLIQYPLWLGPGSWFRVWEMQRLVGEQHERNAGLRHRNEGLEAEVEDLHRGKLAIEERARYALGMIRQDEIFVQLAPPPNGDGRSAGRPGSDDFRGRGRAEAATDVPRSGSPGPVGVLPLGPLSSGPGGRVY
jgi:cell division protein FtsB